MRRHLQRAWTACAAGLLASGLAMSAASAQTAPSEIKIGTLYASSGAFAVPSQSQLQGLKYWAAGVNKTGGVFVKAFDKKIPVKIVAYDDQSSTATATTLYSQLVTQDHVNILMADFGSVLTSVAIPIAAEHHMLLIDPTGSGANFFTRKTNYLADISIPTSAVWPRVLGDFILAHKIKRVAIIYDSNDFDASQATTLKATLEKGGVKPVYYHGVPTSESNYTVLIHTIAASHPDAVIEFGYALNDIAFFHALSGSGLHFNMTFSIFPGQLLALLEKNVGTKALAYTFTYPVPPLVVYNKTNLGPNTGTFVKEWTAATKSPPNALDTAGFNTGLIMQHMLGTAPTFTQLAFHQALIDMSGKTTTLLGEFKINENGAQLGEQLPVAQVVPEGKGLKFVVVYPPNKATGKAIYPAPRN